MDFRGMSIVLSKDDEKFIKEAENINLNIDKLNLKLADFTTNTNKNAVQYLIRKHHFSGVVPFNDNFDILSLKRAVATLKSGRGNSYNQVYEYTLGKSFGRGEVVVYFLLNKALLSGTSQSNDVNINGKKLEVKAVKLTRVDNMQVINDFRLGGTINFNDEISDSMKLFKRAVAEKKDFKIKSEGGKQVAIPSDPAGGMGGNVFKILKQEYPDEYKKIEQNFRKKAAQYFDSKFPIFFNNNESSPGYGTILNEGPVEYDDIFMYRYIGQTKTIAPMIRIK